MISPHIAAVHFRVLMAGMAAEQSVEMFAINRPDAGAGYLTQVVSNLQHVVAYLELAGDHQQLLAYVKNLISYYEQQIVMVDGRGPRIITRFVDPGIAKQVGNNVYMHQGYLLQADPLHGGT